MFMKPLNQESALEVRYHNSIRILLDLALDNNHDEARIAASVLLSANSSWIRPRQEWLVAIPELRCLGDHELNAALGVIHGRITLNQPPETVIQGGSALFHRLWHRWRNIEEW
ncbi:MAG: hypothetical protein DRR42_01525 [Gammaproteobacteria bacterium]|nr:MAG: hypothetical protein DRR42_01525 [Gammaproteobacteria bacterium]